MGAEESPTYQLLYGDVVDVYFMNVNILFSTLLISPISLVLQALTNGFGEWTAVGTICVSISGLNVLYGIYRLVRYKLLAKISLLEIPLSVSILGHEVIHETSLWNTVSPGQDLFQHDENAIVRSLLNKSSLNAFTRMVEALQNDPAGKKHIAELSEAILKLEKDVQESRMKVEAESSDVAKKLDAIDEFIDHPHMKVRNDESINSNSSNEVIAISTNEIDSI